MTGSFDVRRALPVLALLFLGFAISSLEEGNRLYREGRYAEAAEAYQRALAAGESTPELHYNLGTALLQLGQYDAAESAFRAALEAVDPALREWTYYNLGNRFLQDARASADANAKGRLLDAAAQSYKDALRLAPADVDAKWNYELTLREQEEQQREQQESGGGGGGDDRDQPQSGGGGTGGDSPAPSDPGGGGGAGAGESDPGMSREEAERLLNAIEQDERDLYRESLRRARRDQRVLRNW